MKRTTWLDLAVLYEVIVSRILYTWVGIVCSTYEMWETKLFHGGEICTRGLGK